PSGDGLGIRRKPTKRSRKSHDGLAVLFQLPDNSAERRRIRKCSVHQHNSVPCRAIRPWPASHAHAWLRHNEAPNSSHWTRQKSDLRITLRADLSAVYWTMVLVGGGVSGTGHRQLPGTGCLAPRPRGSTWPLGPTAETSQAAKASAKAV